MIGLRVPVGVFAILFASYAYFWHSRDWNTSTRLMLTYSLVDRGTVRINGLEDHTRDRARIEDSYFTDKQPGFSILGIPAYAIGRWIFEIPAHPLDRKGPSMPYWIGDYAVTLSTSGLLTALCGALLTVMAADLGCGPKRSALIGLAYGLATPAYVYATLSYGHQATACLHLIAFGTIRASRTRWWWAFLGGFCASMAAVVEIQAGLVSAILGFYQLGLILSRRARPIALLGFAVGAIGPAATLVFYNVVAFGSPFDMGYFHEDLNEFRQVHAPDNPLGLRAINPSRIPELLWGEYRGLLIFAPILALAVLGWVVLVLRRRWDYLLVTLAICLAVFGVNLSYPEWTGGWSTGPRFLLPLIPFAMLAVATSLSLNWRSIAWIAAFLAILGGVEMLMFQAVGGRIPHEGGAESRRPLREVVWPIVRGAPLPWWKRERGERFERTIGDAAFADWGNALSPPFRWAQFVPFAACQILAIAALIAFGCRPGRRLDANDSATNQEARLTAEESS